MTRSGRDAVPRIFRTERSGSAVVRRIDDRYHIQGPVDAVEAFDRVLQAQRDPMRSYVAKPGEVVRSWFVVDASAYELGRLATRVALVLRGKHKPTFTPHVDTGDFVIVINAAKVRLTGRKEEQKAYHHYSGYPGGMKSTCARDVRSQDPERMIRQAVRGMLPKNRLSRRLITKLKVYAGTSHPHEAQQPTPFPEPIGRGSR